MLNVFKVWIFLFGYVLSKDFDQQNSETKSNFNRFPRINTGLTGIITDDDWER